MGEPTEQRNLSQRYSVRLGTVRDEIGSCQNHDLNMPKTG